MIYETITAILIKHISTLSGIPEHQKENKRHVGKTATPFIRSTMLPAQPEVLTLGNTGITMYQGLLQVDCFIGQDKGQSSALQAADSIMALFPEGLQLTEDGVTVEIVMSYARTAYQLETFYGIPVLIQWKSLYHK